MAFGSINFLMQIALLALATCWFTKSSVGWRFSRAFTPSFPFMYRTSIANGVDKRHQMSIIYMAQIGNRDDVASSKYTAFTAEEDSKLLQALCECIAANRKVSWDEVAAIVGTRTNAQCGNRWCKLRSRHPERVAGIASQHDRIIRRDFSPAEDNTIVEAVEAYIGTNQKVSWDVVAKKVKIRNILQCQNRLKYLMSLAAPPVDLSRIIANKKTLFKCCETWSKKEDTRLLEAMQNPSFRSGGISWKPVAEHVGTKTALQCKARWNLLQVNHPDKVANIQVARRVIVPWSAEEEEKLISLVKEMGSSTRIPWKKVSKQMGTRTDRACYGHWPYLVRARQELKEGTLQVVKQETIVSATGAQSVQRKTEKVEVAKAVTHRPQKPAPQLPRKPWIILNPPEILRQSINALLRGFN
ncbi:hypothetical protein EON64_05680 [archaeon]|nr:MAG: hypothetical protein EON64_05680 [archaeon]